jgi:hypothetical protein
MMWEHDTASIPCPNALANQHANHVIHALRAGSDESLAAARSWLDTPWRHQGRLEDVRWTAGA